MNDTHGQSGTGWYGFDLDGTLAVYDKWQGIDHIGEPVKPMVDLIKKMHNEGKTVKIVTARVAPRPEVECRPNPHRSGEASSPLPDYANDTVMRNPPFRGKVPRSVLGALYSISDWTAANFITDWCLKNLGFLPEITHEKDHLMLELYDDRVKQVIPNKGVLVEDVARQRKLVLKEQAKIVNDLDRENISLLLKLDSKLNGFGAGLSLASIIVFLAVVCIAVYDSHKQKTSLSEAEKNLDTAIHAYIEAKVK